MNFISIAIICIGFAFIAALPAPTNGMYYKFLSACEIKMV